MHYSSEGSWPPQRRWRLRRRGTLILYEHLAHKRVRLCRGSEEEVVENEEEEEGTLILRRHPQFRGSEGFASMGEDEEEG